MAFLFGMMDLELDLAERRRCFVPTRLKEFTIEFEVVGREERQLDDQTIEEVFTVEIPELGEVVQVSSEGIVLNLKAPKQFLEVVLVE